MKTTLNQIKALEPNQGKFLDLMSYHAKTMPDDVEFPVTDILNATNLDFAVKMMEALNSDWKIATEKSLDKEIQFQKSVWDIWREKFSKEEYESLRIRVASGASDTSTQRSVSFGLNFIEDRFERQETERIIAANFLQYFKS